MATRPKREARSLACSLGSLNRSLGAPIHQLIPASCRLLGKRSAFTQGVVALDSLKRPIGPLMGFWLTASFPDHAYINRYRSGYPLVPLCRLRIDPQLVDSKGLTNSQVMLQVPPKVATRLYASLVPTKIVIELSCNFLA